MDIDQYVSSSNLQTINQDEAFNLCSLYTRIGQNFFLFGSKGIGKSHIVMRAIKENNFKINYINLSVLDRSDILGIPNIHDESDVVVYKSPYYLPTLKPNQKVDSVLLFDEADKCDSSVWAPLHEILQFRTLNGKKINAAACVLTGNLMDEHAYSNQVSSTILDRTAKYQLEFDLSIWLSWARENGVYDLIIAFLESNPDLARSNVDTSTMLAFPTARGWTQASTAILQARQHKITDIETITHIVAGFCGNQASVRFKIWYDYARKYESLITTLIESGYCPIEYHKFNPTEQLVFCITASHHTKLKILDSNSKKKQFKYLDNLCKFFNEYKVAKELVLSSVNNSFPFSMITKYGLVDHKAFFTLIQQLQKV